jgi:hypothetical protein
MPMFIVNVTMRTEDKVIARTVRARSHAEAREKMLAQAKEGWAEWFDEEKHEATIIVGRAEKIG